MRVYIVCNFGRLFYLHSILDSKDYVMFLDFVSYVVPDLVVKMFTAQFPLLLMVLYTVTHVLSLLIHTQHV